MLSLKIKVYLIVMKGDTYRYMSEIHTHTHTHTHTSLGIMCTKIWLYFKVYSEIMNDY